LAVSLPVTIQPKSVAGLFTIVARRRSIQLLPTDSCPRHRRTWMRWASPQIAARRIPALRVKECIQPSDVISRRLDAVAFPTPAPPVAALEVPSPQFLSTWCRSIASAPLTVIETCNDKVALVTIDPAGTADRSNLIAHDARRSNSGACRRRKSAGLPHCSTDPQDPRRGYCRQWERD